MASSMIHILTAYKYDPNGSIEFMIGNLIPDSVSDRTIKDKLHLRTVENRMGELDRLSESIDLTCDKNIGILLHLYLDIAWDEGPMKDYITSFEGDNWFFEYREQIGNASSWLYHNTAWSEDYWNKLSSYDFMNHNDEFGYIKEDIEDFVKRNHKWHKETFVDSIGEFDMGTIEKIATSTAEGFRKWINEKLAV